MAEELDELVEELSKRGMFTEDKKPSGDRLVTFDVTGKTKTMEAAVDDGAGRIVGRNGVFGISAVHVQEIGSDYCSFNGVSVKRKELIRGGLDFPAEVMDRVAKGWLQMRGLT